MDRPSLFSTQTHCTCQASVLLREALSTDRGGLVPLAPSSGRHEAPRQHPMLSLSLPGSAAKSSHTHDIAPPAAKRPGRPEHWATKSKGVFSLPVVTAAAHAIRSASSVRKRARLLAAPPPPPAFPSQPVEAHASAALPLHINVPAT